MRDLNALIRHMERANVHERADDVPDGAEVLPTWALFADKWPPKWRALHAAIEELPEIDRGAAERRLQARFLKAMARRPANRRRFEDMTEPD